MKITLVAMGQDVVSFTKARFYLYRKGKAILEIPEWLAWFLSFVPTDFVCCVIEPDDDLFKCDR